MIIGTTTKVIITSLKKSQSVVLLIQSNIISPHFLVFVIAWLNAMRISESVAPASR